MPPNEKGVSEPATVRDEKDPPESKINGRKEGAKLAPDKRAKSLGDREPTDTEQEVTEAVPHQPRQTIGDMVADLLMDPTLDYITIVRKVIERYPSAKTTTRSVASVASVMRRNGQDVPKRRAKKRA